MEDVAIFCGRQESFTAILHILWSTGIFPPVLVCMLHQEKSGNPE
jgi:hypothetical protein